MLTYEVLPDDRIFILEPRGPLSTADFENLALEVDHHLAQHESVNGVLVHSREFPGWENLSGLMSHFRFVRDRHDDIDRVAVATDSAVAALVPQLAGLFVGAEVEGFDYDEKERALEWLRGDAGSQPAAG